MRLLIPDGERDAEVLVTWYAAPRPDGVVPPAVTFELNDVPVTATLSGDNRDGLKYARARLAVPADLVIPGFNTLEITTPTWVPRDAGVNQDERALGIMLHEVEVRQP